MIGYVVRRLLYGVLILIGVNLFTFVLFFAVNTPDDMARLAIGGQRVSTDAIAKWKDLSKMRTTLQNRYHQTKTATNREALVKHVAVGRKFLEDMGINPSAGLVENKVAVAKTTSASSGSARIRHLASDIAREAEMQQKDLAEAQSSVACDDPSAVDASSLAQVLGFLSSWPRGLLAARSEG